MAFVKCHNPAPSGATGKNGKFKGNPKQTVMGILSIYKHAYGNVIIGWVIM